MATAELFSLATPNLTKQNSLYNCMHRFGLCTSGGTSINTLCTVTIHGTEKPSSSQSRITRYVSRGCKLVGCGSAIPKLQVTNDDLAKYVDTSDEWISVRTGIRSRHVLTGNESLTELAVESARKALEMADVHPDDVDLIILSSSTSEERFGCAPLISNRLGCKRTPLAFDMTAACSGFVLSLDLASRYVRGGGFRNVLVIGADALSRYVDWSDRGTCILFGDGAGAVLLQDVTAFKGSAQSIFFPVLWSGKAKSFNNEWTFFSESQMIKLIGLKLQPRTSQIEGLFDCRVKACSVTFEVKKEMVSSSLKPACDIEEDGFFGFDAHSDGDGYRHLNSSLVKRDTDDNNKNNNGSVSGFPPKNRSSYSCIQMNGNEVFRFVVRCVPQSIESALEKAGLTVANIDWLLLHQANQRIIDAVVSRLEFPQERAISNIAKYGNTSSGSIPLALDEAVRSGKVQPGHMIAAAGFGAGLTWGSAIVRWR